MGSEFSLDEGRSGVLPSQWIGKALSAGVIKSAFTIPEESLQPASLDLRLGEKAYRLRCSFLPNGDTVEAKISDLAMGELSLIEGTILERNRPYLIPLMEEVHLPPFLRARANPKSSTGRLDVFTRVIYDRGYQFDELPAGYSGRLYVEVVSRSFTIKVTRGLSLNQLRFMTVGGSVANDDRLRSHHEHQPLLFVDGEAVPTKEVVLRGGLFLSLDLKRRGGRPVGYRAKKNSELLDLSCVDFYEPDAFWEPLVEEPPGRMVLEPDEFYLLISREAISVPRGFAAEMTPYEPTSGELRTHYAGFFDPGFGYSDDGAVKGSRAALEVRAHDVPFMVEHGQHVCKLSFEWMYEPSNVLYGEGIGSNYQAQELGLGKHFKFQRPRRSTQLKLPT